MPGVIIAMQPIVPSCHLFAQTQHYNGKCPGDGITAARCMVFVRLEDHCVVFV